MLVDRRGNEPRLAIGSRSTGRRLEAASTFRFKTLRTPTEQQPEPDLSEEWGGLAIA